MAYISAAEVAAIRNALKDKYKGSYKFGVKSSAGKLGVRVTVLSGPVSFDDVTNGDNTAEINVYHLDRYVQRELFEDIVKIIKTAPATVGGDVWYDNSDIQTDYFDIAYYYRIGVGRDDKPYICTAR